MYTPHGYGCEHSMEVSSSGGKVRLSDRETFLKLE